LSSFNLFKIKEFVLKSAIWRFASFQHTSDFAVTPLTKPLFENNNNNKQNVRRS